MKKKCLMQTVLLAVTVLFMPVVISSPAFANDPAALVAEYQAALKSGDQARIEAARRKLNAVPAAVTYMRENVPNTFKVFDTANNRAPASAKPDPNYQKPSGQTPEQRTASAQQRIDQAHPEIYADDDLAKAMKALEDGTASAEQKALLVKKQEIVDARRFAGGQEAISDDQWRKFKEHSDQVVYDSQEAAGKKLGVKTGKQTSSLKEGEIPRPKSDYDLYHDVEDGQRLTTELQDKMQAETRKNLSKYVEDGKQQPISQEEFTRKKIDNLPADTEKVGKTGSRQDFKDYADAANAKEMEMYTDKRSVEAEQIQRGMKEGPLDLERQGAYGAEQQDQAAHHKKLGDKYRDKYVDGKKNPSANPDDQLFARTEVDAEGAKVAKHVDREHGSRAKSAADIKDNYGVDVDNPKAAVSEGMERSIANAKKRGNAASVELDGAKVSSMDDFIMGQEAKATAEFQSKAANKVPELQADAQRGIAARSRTLNPSQRAEMLDIARQQGGDDFAKGVRDEMIKMDAETKGAGKAHGHAPDAPDGPVKLQGKSSSGMTTAGKAKVALDRLHAMESRALGVGELGPNASKTRVRANNAATKAGGALAVAGVAYEAGTLGHKMSKARILYEAAAQTEDDDLAMEYYNQAQRLEQEAADQVKTGAALGAAGMVAPVAVGGAMTGYGAYQGTRYVMENTETGQAAEESIQSGMQSGIETVRDTVTHASGQDTYDEIAEDQLTRRQSRWLQAMRNGEIKLEEGVTPQDVLVLVERNQDKVASPEDPNYLSGVVTFVKPDSAQVGGGVKDGSEDTLAGAMLAAADQDGGWKNDGYRDVDPGTMIIMDDFGSMDSAGRTEREVFVDTTQVMSGSTSTIQADDIDKIIKADDARDFDRNVARRRTQEEIYTQLQNGWNNTLREINQSIAQHNQAQREILQQKLDEAKVLVQQVQSGQMSDEDFTSKLNDLERQGAALDQQAQQTWTQVINGIVNGGVNGGPTIPGLQGPQISGNANDPCGQKFDMSTGGISCKCPGYKFNIQSVSCQGPGGAGGAAGGSAADVNTILSSVPPDQIDQRAVQCDSASKSGGNTPASITVAVPPTPGVAQIRYNMMTIKDRIIVQYGGATIHDTGCVSGSKTIPLQLSGGANSIHVVVQPACAGSSTNWNFTVSCPSSGVAYIK